jgi:hypothetical protein
MNSNGSASRKTMLKRPACKVALVGVIIVVILAMVLVFNQFQGYSIYQHPQHLLGTEQLKEAAKIIINDQINGKLYVINDGPEMAQVTAIIEEMQITRKENSKDRSGRSQSRYSISYYDDLNSSISEYRCTVHLAPVWTDNNVKPSYKYELINEKDILKQLDDLLNNTKVAYDVQTLIKNKTPYIGNNSKVAALINALPLPEGVTRNSIQLNTSQIPYGVTIEYILNDDSMRVEEEQFLRNSLLLFALIDNADLVTHIGYWNAKELSSLPFRFSYTRADAEKMVGGDLRQFADNHEKLAELIQMTQFSMEDETSNTKEESPTDLSN